MNRIINIILSGLLWRRYKFLIISLLILIAVIVLTGRIHQDYIEFAKAADQPDFLGWSFFIKWFVWVLCFFVFYLVNNQHNKRKEKEQIQSESSTSVIAKFMDRKAKSAKVAKPEKSNKNEQFKDNAGGVDPFEHLRSKDKLRSYAEVIIDNHEKDN